eukprot:scaffold194_cov277-Pinguiococcus_pyrenoidosus.AAC.8
MPYRIDAKVLREGKPVSLKTEKRALAMLQSQTDELLADVMSSIARRENQATLQQLGANVSA